ncbi:peptide deformylase [Streptomyces sp. NPDC014676]|uniref:peptide deformylase n=1 Tax=Streptomyces sp. NPDC014676 TaxID=3364879 RepID=UPI0037023173
MTEEVTMRSGELTDKVAALVEESGPLPMVQAGDPILRETVAPYSGQLDDELMERLISKMRSTMEQTPNAVGLAAPQIGLPLRIAVMALQPKPVTARIARSNKFEQISIPFTVLINPSYRVLGETRAASFEGCLSISGWQAVVVRPEQIQISREDETGKQCTENYTGIGARIAQHEIDHLNGTLYIDRAELRSLSTAEQVVQRWHRIGMAATAKELGFALPE